MKRRHSTEPLTREQAYNYALRLLNQRSYTRAGLREKLLQRSTTPSDTESILIQLEKLGFIDDARYAESFVRSESLYRHTSQRIIAQKLRQKGVQPEVIARYTSATEHDELPDEYTRALYQAEKWRRKNPGELTFTLKQKLAATLYRRGFTPTTVTQVIREIQARNGAS